MFKTFCDWKGCEKPAPHYQGGGYGFELRLKANDGSALAYKLPNSYHLCPKHLVAHVLGHLATCLGKDVAEDALALSGYFPRPVDPTPVAPDISRPMNLADRDPKPGDILLTKEGVTVHVMQEGPKAPGGFFGLSYGPAQRETASRCYQLRNPEMTYVSRADGGPVEVTA